MNEKLRRRQEARTAGCRFMNDRDKGRFEELENTTVTLVDAYKIHKEDTSYWAFIVAEDPENFYFANTALAIILDDAEELAQEDASTIADQIDGLQIRIGAMERGKKGKSFRPVDIV